MIKDIIHNNENIQPNSRDITQLKAHFPHYFDKDGNFLIERLNATLRTENIDIQKESYELNFLGKSYARYQTSTQTETVIAPDTEHNQQALNQQSENLYIVGDNLDALKHLLRSYSNKIKCIYIDPPYNTGSDGFVYPDNFSFSAQQIAEKMGIDEEQAKKIIDMRGKSSHSAWLTFMYPRLVLARELLTDDGVIFISIDDNEQANLKLLCDEIFGEENFVAELPTIMNLKGNNDEFGFAGTHEFTLVYAKNKEHSLLYPLPIDEEDIEEWQEDEIGFYKQGANLKSTGANAPREKRPNLFFPIFIDIENNIYVTEDDEEPKKYIGSLSVLLPITDNQEMSWRWSKGKFISNITDVIVSRNKNNIIALYKKQRPALGDLPTRKPKSIFYKPEYSSGNGTAIIKTLFKNNLFSNTKPTQLIKDFLTIGSSEDAIILDFFSGSATTAHAVMQLNAEDGGNRKYIMVQLPEVIKKKDKLAYQAGYKTIDEIGQERIKRAAAKIKQETNANIDYGFKLFRLEELAQETLDKLDSFNPNILFNDNYIDEFAYGNSSGKQTILTTWLNQDGYGLNPTVEQITLKNYQLNVCKNSAYIIEEGITTEDLICLIEKIERSELPVNRLVVYPYAIAFSLMLELKRNTKMLQANKQLEIIERY